MNSPALRSALLAALLLSPFLFAAPARAQEAQSFAVVGDQAFALPAPAAGATPDAVAHFGCELRSFAGQRLFCYGPGAIRSAYGINRLLAKGNDGHGQTIVIIDAYGSPTIESDLATFDAVFGLPPPPSFQVIHMTSTPFDYTSNSQLGWAEETSLDVQWAHAVAPGAKIVLIAATSSRFLDLLAAQDYAIDNNLGDVISESYGASEGAILASAGGTALLALEEASYARAKAKGITVFVSSGDSGAIVDYPATSPNVVSVGGTNLFFGTLGAATPNGNYVTESVWNDGNGAGGSGISAFFAAPAFQTQNLPASTLSVLAGHRGYPDISYNAGVAGGVLTYLGFLGTAFGNPAYNGFYIFGGTSAGAPQWAGLSTLIKKTDDGQRGSFNDRLYRIQGAGAHDVTAGNNLFNGVPGYIAAPSWDIATGWGTPSSELLRRLGGDD